MYFSKLSSSVIVFWGSFCGGGEAWLGSAVLANTWQRSCREAYSPLFRTSSSRPRWMLFRMQLVYSIWRRRGEFLFRIYML